MIKIGRLNALGGLHSGRNDMGGCRIAELEGAGAQMVRCGSRFTIQGKFLRRHSSSILLVGYHNGNCTKGPKRRTEDSRSAEDKSGEVGQSGELQAARGRYGKLRRTNEL
jgi:hypothetical protein